ncbi:ribonuclease domain-containing protein [Paenibacillus tuaregi]|uniref:ribonuclease domain-containing protein n=1 Tax=Paenibacillus tuaregi TaxID=1816681 RepID=UPI000837C5EF|nr:ribonuclease domain-containing protein [Paenibacillus tuaregi]
MKALRSIVLLLLSILILAGCGLTAEKTQPSHNPTSFEAVASYIREHHQLPDNFITKKEARRLGYPQSGNLNEVAPGKSIGGDVFQNREGKLPRKKGRTWYEADINYTKGPRGKDRIVFSSDGLIYKTEDHYETYQQMK